MLAHLLFPLGSVSFGAVLLCPPSQGTHITLCVTGGAPSPTCLEV